MTPLLKTLRKALVVPSLAGLMLAGAFLMPEPTAAARERLRVVPVAATVEIARNAELEPERRQALRPVRTVIQRPALRPAPEPVKKVARPEIAPVTAVLPVTGYRLTGRFGNAGSMWSSTHTGLDFAAPLGTPVRAVVSGRVESAAYAGAYGLRVSVVDAEGRTWWYCHLSASSVQIGQQLSAGDVLGSLGSTGNSTGPHLHLEIRQGDVPVNPETLLPSLGVQP
ncbi:M23 family metallopeptidase [Nocardioides sp. YIM 152588]|uniref:M23 family metallopeptidase n=1 Tax=Nocardioides sp. YIM 152588 TaxID=3158259 RepID=UPI0032E3D67E